MRWWTSGDFAQAFWSSWELVGILIFALRPGDAAGSLNDLPVVLRANHKVSNQLSQSRSLTAASSQFRLWQCQLLEDY